MKTWRALREALLRAYDSPNHVLNAEMNLRSRMQRPDETWGAFCRDVWQQFQSILPHVPEAHVVQILVRNGNPLITQRFADIHTFDTVREVITAGNIAEDRNRNDIRFRQLQPPPAFAHVSAVTPGIQATCSAPFQGNKSMQKAPPALQNYNKQPFYKKKNREPSSKCSVCGSDPAICRGVCRLCKRHGHRQDVCPNAPASSSSQSRLN